ncbi:MAG: 2,3,4,5-tetrahydropyridine-2,6-dicarboxylate N-succinyltransferase [Acidimicrobiales bacterium]
MADLQATIEDLWTRRAEVVPGDADAMATVRQAIDTLDRGDTRVAEVARDGSVLVHEWLKEAILLFFKLAAVETIDNGAFQYADKIPLKRGFTGLGVRAVPGAIARWGSYIERGVILMPSFVNIGARVGANTMVYTWATVGSCAQIGANVHLSGGVGIGGVLEPPQAAPVIIGDEALIGSRCMITQGARVGDGAVLGEGCVLNRAIPVIDAQTGEELSRGVVPPWCVGVTASRRRTFAGGEFGLPCILVIRRLTPGQRHDSAKLNDLLREEGVST